MRTYNARIQKKHSADSSIPSYIELTWLTQKKRLCQQKTQSQSTQVHHQYLFLLLRLLRYPKSNLCRRDDNPSFVLNNNGDCKLTYERSRAVVGFVSELEKGRQTWKERETKELDNS